MTAPATSAGKTILLIDDEESVRSIVLRILRRANYNVLEAGSGSEALRIADAHGGAIDLVVTDVNMPGLRGPQVVEELAVARPGLKVLFMSGHNETPAQRGVGVRANFLPKPFSSAELTAAVERALRQT